MCQPRDGSFSGCVLIDVTDHSSSVLPTPVEHLFGYTFDSTGLTPAANFAATSSLMTPEKADELALRDPSCDVWTFVNGSDTKVTCWTLSSSTILLSRLKPSLDNPASVVSIAGGISAGFTFPPPSWT